MIHNINVHPRFWGKAAQTAVYLLNRTGSRLLHNVTLYQLWYGIKPSVAHVRIFGSSAYVHIPSKLRKKLDRKSKHCILMGYSATSKA